MEGFRVGDTCTVVTPALWQERGTRVRSGVRRRSDPGGLWNRIKPKSQQGFTAGVQRVECRAGPGGRGAHPDSRYEDQGGAKTQFLM